MHFLHLSVQSNWLAETTEVWSRMGRWSFSVRACRVGTVSLLYQMSTFHVPIAERWHTHWLLTDGVRCLEEATEIWHACIFSNVCKAASKAIYGIYSVDLARKA